MCLFLNPSMCMNGLQTSFIYVKFYICQNSWEERGHVGCINY